MDDQEPDTLRCSPPEGCHDKEPGFYERLLASAPRDAGAKRPTTWQKNHERDPRFNARGCR